VSSAFFLFLDQRLQTGGPIITNLSPKSLASHDKLAELINATHCVIPKANCSDHDFHSKYRTFDGTCNNLQHPLWGAASVPFNRIIKAKYWDTEGCGEPHGFPGQLLAAPLPSPHLISKRYVKHRKPGNRGGTFSHMMMQWGQFLDHDITFTAESEGSEHCALPR
jgi:peroxidase